MKSEAIKNDVYWLKKAIYLGNQKKAPYNFGAVIVKDGKELVASYGHVQETNNPTLHAECSAIIFACQELKTTNLIGYTLYASHEPCLMCIACASWSNIDRIIYSTPKSEQKKEMYESGKINIQKLNKQLYNPMEIKHLKI